jgi:hypothetical protein
MKSQPFTSAVGSLHGTKRKYKRDAKTDVAVINIV